MKLDVRARDTSILGEGHSTAVADSKTRERVKVTILGLFASHGPMTDEQLVGAYEAVVTVLHDVPKVTPQRVRTARAALVNDGVVHPTGVGLTRLGNRATVWAPTSK